MMGPSILSKTALLLIDIQKGLDELEFYGGHRNNPSAEQNASKILEAFRTKNLPIYHVRHGSKNPDSPLHRSKPGFQIKEEVKPKNNEPLFTKTVNSAFIDTDLEKTLKQDGIETVIIVGLTTNHCISTSVRMAANLGFETLLVSDATAAFDMFGVDGKKYDANLMHQTALASLKDEFAKIVDSKQVLQELEKDLY